MPSRRRSASAWASAWASASASAVVLFALTACAPKTVPPPARAAVDQSPAAAASPTAARSMQVVNATILANHCQDLGRGNARLAEAAMYRLVEGCRSVPGGSARFEATLDPGGTISIEASPGEPQVVPICILKHSLTHRVTLAAPCRLSVRIQEQAVPVIEPPAGGAPSSSSDAPPPR